MNRKGLRDTDVHARGFIFFPGEAKKAVKLRLHIKEVDTGKIHSLIIKL